MPVILIADSGATKAEWCLVNNGKKKNLFTQGISPYFLNTEQITELVRKQLISKIPGISVDRVFYYGTGCASRANALIVKKALANIFKEAFVKVDTDLLAAARALCMDSKGLACILGTGMSCSFYNGKTIVKDDYGLGYVLGDEGSGAYLGKKVIQYYLYNTFDEELKALFDAKYCTTRLDILENVYKRPLPNRYLASFAMFLADNRGHYMIENIIEDGLNDFFFYHLCKFREVWKYPVNFVGSISFGFRDVIKSLCQSYEFQLGSIFQKPMDKLVEYHIKQNSGNRTST